MSTPEGTAARIYDIYGKNPAILTACHVDCLKLDIAT
jgi:hypothetical protein